MATFYRTGVETYSIIGTAGEMGDIPGGEERIPDGSTYFAVDENMFYTFYDGQWYETLPEAARLYHDDVGTDTKPIKLVGGVATVVANELAEDSKVVHLAGTETITGTKNFTGFITNITNQNWNNIEIGSRSLSNYIRSRKYDSSGKSDVGFLIGTTYADASNTYVTYTTYAPREVFGDETETQCSYRMAIRSGKDGSGRLYVSQGAADGTSSELTLVSYAPGTGYRCDVSTYTADNGADTRVVNRAMLAQTPTVVHTTGNETIAGTKTFSGTLNAPKIRSASIALQMDVGTWYKMYTITPASVGQQIFFEIFNTSSISSLVDAKLRIQVPNANWPYDPAANLFNVGSILVGKLAKTADGKLEVWLCKETGTAQYILLNAEYLDFLIPTPVGTAGEEPVQGTTYPLVKNITVVS